MRTVTMVVHVDGQKRTIMMILSFASMTMIYFMMLLGVYITSSHQGLSCPDCPLCPNGFGIPSNKYLFEHTHRMMAVFTAAVVVAVALYAVKNVRTVVKTAITAGIIIAIQITLGVAVVYTKLQAVIVATHLS